ncbi:MAG: hypothetical protein U1F43_15510 [Myxococcota bacterium]
MLPFIEAGASAMVKMISGFAGSATSPASTSPPASVASSAQVACVASVASRASALTVGASGATVVSGATVASSPTSSRASTSATASVASAPTWSSATAGCQQPHSQKPRANRRSRACHGRMFAVTALKINLLPGPLPRSATGRMFLGHEDLHLPRYPSRHRPRLRQDLREPIHALYARRIDNAIAQALRYGGQVVDEARVLLVARRSMDATRAYDPAGAGLEIGIAEGADLRSRRCSR